MIKFRIIFFLLLFCKFNYSKLNAQNYSQSSYGGGNSDLAVSVSCIANGSSVFLCTSNSFNTKNDLLVSKVDKKGDVLWTKTYGGSQDETAVHLEATKDEGFIIVGNTISFGNGNTDIYIIKTDSIGNIIWSKTYGGSQGDFAGCIKEVPSGGYIVSGRTESYGEGSNDGYLIRVDDEGDVLWSKSYGTSNDERFYKLDNTFDNGFIISGIQKKNSSYDQLVLKVGEDGEVLFSNNFGDAGGLGNDAGDCIKQTNDGGYIMSGQYRSFGSGGEDLALTKINSLGNLEWAKVFGNSGNDRAVDLSIDGSGNYILAGYTNSFGLGNFDGFLIKVDSLGSPLWYRTFGQNSDDCFSAIEITPFGYVMVGYTNSLGLGLQDIFQVKTNFEGEPSFECANVNVIDAFILPVKTIVTLIANTGCISTDAFTIASNVILERRDLLPVLPELDSIYVKGEYGIPLSVSPAVGQFEVDGSASSVFVPNGLGNHIIDYKYEIVQGCIYHYEKEVSVTDDCKYSITDLSVKCDNKYNLISIPLKSNIDIGKGVIGINYCLSFDSSIVVPTGNFNLSNLVTHGNNNWATAVITKVESDKIQIKVHYTNAPLQTSFEGIGDIIYLEFMLKDNSNLNSQCNISICELKEIHESFQFSTCGKFGSIIFTDNRIKGKVLYKEDSLVTKRLFEDFKMSLSLDIIDSNYRISTSDNIGQFEKFKIKNFINNKFTFNVSSNSFSVSHFLLKYRNGFDAFQMEKIITNQINTPLQIEPIAYAMIAADVDISDKIRSNDISLLQEVIVKKIPGFPQQLPPEQGQNYLDWRFIDKKTVDHDQGFKKANSYPYYSNKGYCRDNVPDVPFYLSNQGSCDTSYVETYSAILLGDLVNGGSGVNYRNFDNQSSSVTLDIDDIHDLGYGTYRVFLNHTLNAQDKFVSLDFALDYDESSISIANTKLTVEDKLANPQWLFNDYNREEFLFTSYSVNGYPVIGSLMYIDIYKPSGLPTIEDLGQLHVFVNGTEVPATIRLRSQTVTGIDISKDVSDFVNLYPNPVDERITISLPLLYAKDLHIEFLNTIGQSVLSFDQEQVATEIELDLSYLPAGLYTCLIQIQDKAAIVKKIVVN